MYAEHNHWILGNNYQIYYYYTYAFELYLDTFSCLINLVNWQLITV